MTIDLDFQKYSCYKNKIETGLVILQINDQSIEVHETPTLSPAMGGSALMSFDKNVWNN
jgi:hypothetical protein